MQSTYSPALGGLPEMAAELQLTYDDLQPMRMMKKQTAKSRNERYLRKARTTKTLKDMLGHL